MQQQADAAGNMKELRQQKGKCRNGFNSRSQMYDSKTGGILDFGETSEDNCGLPRAVGSE